MRYRHFPATHPVITTDLGPLKRYDLTGKNYDRRITFDMIVFAPSASAAIKRADEYRRDENLVTANTWVTRPGL